MNCALRCSKTMNYLEIKKRLIVMSTRENRILPLLDGVLQEGVVYLFAKQKLVVVNSFECEIQQSTDEEQRRNHS